MDPLRLLNRPLPTVRQRYGERDTILCALGVGAAAGTQAWDERHLRWVYEPSLQALPTVCAMLGDPGFRMREADTGLDWRRLLHGEQAMQWLRPLPPEGDVRAHNRVLRVADRGAERGAIFVVERARPARTPDHRVRVATDTRAPLLYRLSSDLNPLHADPAVARRAGFERPIMHGMCTFGLLGLLLVTEFCDFDAALLTSLRTRFTAPLYPGETLECEFWRDGPRVQFRATAAERAAVVLNQGLATLHDGAASRGETT